MNLLDMCVCLIFVVFNLSVLTVCSPAIRRRAETNLSTPSLNDEAVNETNLELPNPNLPQTGQISTALVHPTMLFDHAVSTSAGNAMCFLHGNDYFVQPDEAGISDELHPPPNSSHSLTWLANDTEKCVFHSIQAAKSISWDGSPSTQIPVIEVRSENQPATCLPCTTIVSPRNTSARLCSFEGWPRAFPTSQQMAEAGFVYTGLADIVECIFCGISMCNWEAEDNPIQEHLREAPDCPFIRQIQTVSEHSRLAINDGRSMQAFSENDRSVCIVSSTGTRLRPSGGSDLVTSNTREERRRRRSNQSPEGGLSDLGDVIEAHLNSPAALRLLDEGYRRADVARAVSELIRGGGRPDISYDLLQGALLVMGARQRNSTTDRDKPSS